MTNRDLFLAILVPFFWAGNFVITKIATAYTPPLTLSSLLFFIVAIVLMPVMSKINIARRDIILLALLGGVFNHGLIFLGIWLGADIALSVIIIELSVPLAVFLSIILLGEKVTNIKIIGLTITIIGVVILSGKIHSYNVIAILIMTIASVSIAILNIIVKKIGKFDVLNYLGYMAIYSLVIMLPFTIILEAPSFNMITNLPHQAVYSLIYFAISMLFGVASWFYLLQKYPVNIISPFALIAPIFGIFFSYYFLNEPITASLIIGGCIVLLGQIILIYSHKEQAPVN